eukprot:NODE_124_length_17341_cov_0.560028.p3 type:complete len:654 gc:universal NODE_124_length_17341_cov_0.560028:2746-785(-)
MLGALTMERHEFQKENINLDKIIASITDIDDFENRLENHLEQIQKDIVSVLDGNYLKLQELLHKIQHGLTIGDKIEDELDVVQAMTTKTTMVIENIDSDSPEGRLLKIREQKRLLITENYLKLDLDYLSEIELNTVSSFLDLENLERLEYYILIANRTQSFIKELLPERQVHYSKKFEPIRQILEKESLLLIDQLKLIKSQMVTSDVFSECLESTSRCLQLSDKWTEALPTLMQKLVSEPMYDLQKTLTANVNQNNVDIKYSIIENYLTGIPLKVSKILCPFSSASEKSIMILDNIFQLVVKFLTELKITNTNENSQSYLKDYQKSLLFLAFFKANFIDPFQIESEFANHPSYIVFKRKFNPIPFAKLQKAEISKILQSLHFDSSKMSKSESTFNFEYFSKLNEILNRMSSIQAMPDTQEVSCSLKFLIFDHLTLNGSKLRNLPSNFSAKIFSDLLIILANLKDLSGKENLGTELYEEYKSLISLRFNELKIDFEKLSRLSLSSKMELKLSSAQSIKNIPSIVRMGSKDISSPSTYVDEIIDGIEELKNEARPVHLNIEKIYQDIEVFTESSIKNEIVAYIITISTEVVNTIKKTEESLKRFKKQNTSNLGISDEDKMRAQIYLDCATVFSKVNFFHTALQSKNRNESSVVGD